jgi:hypothetical protein
LHSRPEHEAEEVFSLLRAVPHIDDLGAFIHEAVTAMTRLQQQQQQQQGQSGGPTQYYYHGQYGQHPLPQQEQQDQDQDQDPHQHQHQHQHHPQQHDQSMFAHHSYTITTSTTQLPPLRSMVEIPTGGHDTAHHHQPFLPPSQRNMSLVSAMSSGSYTSLSSSSEGNAGSSISPRENPHSGWAQGSPN